MKIHVYIKQVGTTNKIYFYLIISFDHCIKIMCKPIISILSDYIGE